MGILETPKLERFDPANDEHVAAYAMIRSGRQHPTLRFHVDHPYVDVVAMMAHELADYHAIDRYRL